MAAAYGVEPVVAALLEAGADARCRNSSEWTPGQEKGDSTSLQRGCSRSDVREESIHALSSPREMIARPKMSQNEWKTTEIRASKVGNVSPFSCPGEANDDRAPEERRGGVVRRAEAWAGKG